MKTLYWGLAGGALVAAVAAAALIKRKPAMLPKGAKLPARMTAPQTTIASRPSPIPTAAVAAAKSMMASPVALPAPMFYMPAKGDKPTTVFARFGSNLAAFQKANGSAFVPTTAGRLLRLPPGVADLGKRAGAMGEAK